MATRMLRLVICVDVEKPLPTSQQGWEEFVIEHYQPDEGEQLVSATVTEYGPDRDDQLLFEQG